MKNQAFILICFLAFTFIETTKAQDILLISSSSDAQSDTRQALWLNGSSFEIAGPQELNRMDFNLYEYKVIIVCDNWDAALSDAIVEHRIGLESFARRGGVVVYLFSGNPTYEQLYRKTWQALSLQLKRVSSSAEDPEIGVINPDQSAHRLAQRFANNYLGMFTHYGFENPNETWQTIAYTESSKVPIMLESDIGRGKIIAVSILHLTEYFQRKYHYYAMFRNIINYSLDNTYTRER